MKMESGILKGPDFKSPTFLEETNQTLGEYILRVAETTEDRVCLINAITNAKITSSEIVNQSFNLATEIQYLTCNSDSIVGIVSENCLEYLVVILGTVFSGSTVTCFNPFYTTGELTHTFGITRPSIVFCSSNNYKKIKETNEAVKCVKHIILLDTENENLKSEQQFSNLIRSSGKTMKKIKRKPNDTAAILYSSGTTGYPKGVMLTHRNIIYILKMIRDEHVIGFHGKCTAGTVPMYHAYGLFTILQTITEDQTLVFMRTFEKDLFLSIIQKYKVRFLFLVPPLVTILLKDSSVKNYDLSSVKEIICGAAPLSSKVEEEIRQKYNVNLRQAYGMTELTFLCTVRSKDSTKKGSCGSLICGTMGKVVDAETGAVLGARERGEICIKGPQIMKGYYGNVKETAKIIDSEGWLHTGDVGYYDEDGEFFIVDRIKELIKYKGYQVAPAELEGLLLKHKDVSDAAVIGKPDEMSGELPLAFVVKQLGSNITPTDLVKYIAELVSPQKRLRGGVIFVQSIPKNPSGKILRRKLRETYAELQAKY